MNENLTHVLVLVIALGGAAQWLAWRFRLPAIVLLSVAGVVTGPVLGLIRPEEHLGELFHPVVSLCVAIILFEGGLNLKIHELKHAGNVVKRLVSLGVLFNWLIGAAAAYWIGGLSLPVAMVFAAIIVVTGPTVILPLLRQANLERQTSSYLKWEGILVDPIGALLAVLVFESFVHTGSDAGVGFAAKGLALALLSGILVGGGGGFLMGFAYVRGLVPEFLKAPFSIGAILLVFAASNGIQEEAGLLAVTIMGLVFANMNLPSIDEMRRFKESITLILVSAVFILMTASLDPSLLNDISWRWVALLACVMLVVRPLATFVATIGTGLDWRRRTMVGWIAPRGVVAAATAAAFAPALTEAGHEDAKILVPLVFSLIFATVLAHGFSIGWLGRKLGLASHEQRGLVIVGVSPFATALAQTLLALDSKVLLLDSSWHRLREARLSGVPVYYGDILSDRAEEALELGEMSTLIAATSNDAYNALVCTSMAPEFGRNQVYQLPLYAGDAQDPKTMTRARRGNIAFSEDAVFEDLWQHFSQGWTFQKTRLSTEYNYQRYLEELPEGAILMLRREESGTLQVHSPGIPMKPKTGDTLVWFGPPRQVEASPKEPA